MKRFIRDHRCPICDGADTDPRGTGRRCHGFLSDDGRYAHCSREERAGDLRFTPEAASTFAHRLDGPCGCGTAHTPDPLPPASTPMLNRQARRHPGRHTAATPASRIVATYDYCDADGVLVFQEVKYDPKRFSQRRPDGCGGWISNLEGVSRILYGLNELRATDPTVTVFVVEGPKDVESLRLLGLVATTNPEGAGKWRDHFAEDLRDRPVVILADNDDPGRAHAEQVARSCYGIAASVKVICLPGLPPKGDVSDWLAAGHTRTDLEQLAEVWPQWRPDDLPAAVTIPTSADHSDGEARERRLLRDLDRQEARARKWIVRARAAQKERTLLRRRCEYHEQIHSRVVRALSMSHSSPQERIVAVRLALELEHQAAEDKGLPGGRFKVSYSESVPVTDQDRRKAGYSLAARAGCSPKTVSRSIDHLVTIGAVDRFVDDPRLKDGQWSRDAYILRPAQSGHPGIEMLDAFIAYRPPTPATDAVTPTREPARCPTHPAAPIQVTHVCTEGGEVLHQHTYTPPPIGQIVRIQEYENLIGQFVPSEDEPSAEGQTPIPAPFVRAFWAESAGGDA